MNYRATLKRLGLLAALPLALAAQWQVTHAQETLGLGLYALATLLLVTGARSPAVCFAPRAFNGRTPTVVLLAALTGLAAATRLYRLDTVPPGLWADETDIARLALGVVDGQRRAPWDVIPHLEVAYLYLYFQAAWLAALGSAYYAIKLPGVLAGIAATPLLYLLAARFLRPGIALVVAGLWAVAQWTVNDSRWGHVNSWTPVFFCLSLWLVWRALEDRKRLSWALAGLIYGLSLYVYAANRPMILLIGLFILHWHLFIERRIPQRSVVGIGLFALAAGLVLAPLVATYASNPTVYLGRTMSVSIFDPRFTPDPRQTFFDNIVKYGQVFHYRGDFNPRHNIPGWPMLDLILASLFTLGLAAGLRFFRRPGAFLGLAWIVVYLFVGVMTTEAPNTYRIYGILPGILLLVGVALQEIGGFLDGLATIPRRALGVGLSALLVGTVAYQDLNAYFVVGANHPSTWGAFSAPHTRAGQAIADLQGPWTVYLDRDFHGSSQVDVLTWARPKLPMKLTDQLVPPDDQTSPTFWGFAPYLFPAATYLQTLYPHGAVQVARGVQGEVLFGSFMLPAGGAPAGLLVDRWMGTEFSGRSIGTTATEALAAEMGAASPEPYSVRWRGALRVRETGPVDLILTSSNPTRLYLNGDLLLESTTEAPSARRRVWLPGGSLPIRLERVIRQPDQLLLEWQPAWESGPVALPLQATAAVPMPEGGLLAVYFEGTRLADRPLSVRHDPLILSGNFGNLATFAQRWVGELVVTRGGEYGFTTWSDDAARMWVGDRLVIDDWFLHGTSAKSGQLALSPGRHPIAIEYLDYGGYHRFDLLWRPPGETEQPIPVSALRWRPEQVAAAANPPPPPMTIAIPIVDAGGRTVSQVSVADITAPRRPPRQDANHFGAVLKVRDRLFDRGIGVFVPTTLTFNLDARFARLQGSAGIDRDAHVDHKARLRILLDGREVFDSGPRGIADPPVPFDLNVSGAQRLSLVADDAPAQRDNSADWLDLRLRAG